MIVFTTLQNYLTKTSKFIQKTFLDIKSLIIVSTSIYYIISFSTSIGCGEIVKTLIFQIVGEKSL